jgi:hypothetical protein
MVVSAATVLGPAWVLAGNQEVAEQIAASLRESGQLHGYSIGVKYQDGTVWLRGRVASREQMNTALKLVFQTAGVSRVVNNLSVGTEDEQIPTEAAPTGLASVPPLEQAQGSPAAEQPSQPRTAGTAVETASPVATSFTPDAVQPVSAVSPGEPTVAPQLVAPATASTASSDRADPVGTSQVAVSESLNEGSSSVSTTAAEIAPQAPAPQPLASLSPASRAPAPRLAAAGVPGRPLPIAYVGGAVAPGTGAAPAAPVPQYAPPVASGTGSVQYDQPYVPNYAWPCYAAYPNYAALTYPRQYSPTAWPYIGPFYPYPQVPLGWRKVVLEWHDGWWNLDFDDGASMGPFHGLFRSHHN